MIEFEALGGVQREQRDGGALVEIVGAADQRCVVEKIGERFAALGAFGDGVDQFAEIVDAGLLVGALALAQHVEIAGDFQHRGDELMRRQLGVFCAQIFDERVEAAQWREGAARAGLDGAAEGCPER